MLTRRLSTRRFLGSRMSPRPPIRSGRSSRRRRATPSSAHSGQGQRARPFLLCQGAPPRATRSASVSGAGASGSGRTSESTDLTVRAPVVAGRDVGEAHRGGGPGGVVPSLGSHRAAPARSTSGGADPRPERATEDGERAVVRPASELAVGAGEAQRSVRAPARRARRAAARVPPPRGSAASRPRGRRVRPVASAESPLPAERPRLGSLHRGTGRLRRSGLGRGRGVPAASRRGYPSAWAVAAASSAARQSSDGRGAGIGSAAVPAAEGRPSPRGRGRCRAGRCRRRRRHPEPHEVERPRPPAPPTRPRRRSR